MQFEIKVGDYALVQTDWDASGGVSDAVATAVGAALPVRVGGAGTGGHSIWICVTGMAGAIRQGRRPPSPLFNGHLHDAHFSPQGAATWGTAVGRRLALLRDYQEVSRK